jgi:glycosyltransferase 2 family protein
MSTAAAGATAESGTGPQRSRRRPTLLRQVLRIVFLLAVLASFVAAIVGKRHQIGAGLRQLSPGWLAVAAVLVLAGTVAMGMSWRALLADLGSPLPARPAARVFFLGQLGKYLPGSVWPVVAQAELGRDHGVPARRSATAAMLTLAISLVASLVVAAATLPLATPAALRRYGWAFAAVPVLIVALHPRVLNPLVATAFRILRRPAPTERLTLAGIGRAAAWALLAWVLYGLQVAVLIGDLGATGPRAVLAATGAFALAWSVGFLVVVVPAGAGIREGVLTVALSPVLVAAPALLVALISRLLLSGGDLLLAGAAVLAARRTGHDATTVAAAEPAVEEAAAEQTAARQSLP